jgi:hypothetical protein
LQDQGPNRRLLLWPNGRGGERDRKRQGETLSGEAEETSESETAEELFESVGTTSKPGGVVDLGRVWELPAYCPDGVRQGRRRELGIGSCVERGNLRPDVKGVAQVEAPLELEYQREAQGRSCA